MSIHQIEAARNETWETLHEALRHHVLGLSSWTARKQWARRSSESRRRMEQAGR
jgi:hypothetical protein